eukprot:gene20303-26354_t
MLVKLETKRLVIVRQIYY